MLWASSREGGEEREERTAREIRWLSDDEDVDEEINKTNA